MQPFSQHTNPLLDDSGATWERLIDAIDPASLLVLIEDRMSARLRQSHTPEDVLQESLLHAWRDRAKCEWRGVKAFRSWLLTIIDHRIGHLAAAEEAQKRGGDLRITPFSAIDPADSNGTGFAGPPGSTTPSRIAMYHEHAAAMRAALDSLPDDVRSVVRLRLFEQVGLQEIADRLGIHISMVRRRFASGLEEYERKLRAQLAGSTFARPEPASSTIQVPDSSP